MKDSDAELKVRHRSGDQPVLFLPGMPAPMPLTPVVPAKHWDPLVEWFGPVMRGVRVWRGLSLAEAARRVGCADDTLRRLEYVKCDPPLDLAQRVARVYELPLWIPVAEAARLGAGVPCGLA